MPYCPSCSKASSRFYCHYADLKKAHTICIRMRRDVMGFQSVLLVERLFTKFTFKWFIGCVDTLVSVESRSESKAFSTNLTSVGSLTSVAINMSLEVSLLIKTFSAVLALVQPFSRMCSQVVLEMSQLFESPTTRDALMRLLARVRVSMDFHVHVLVEPLAAKVADERFVVSVCSQMRIQVGSAAERLVTLGTNVRLDGSVSQLVAT